MHNRILEIQTINYLGEIETTTHICYDLQDAMNWIYADLSARIELHRLQKVKYKTYTIPFDID